MPLIVCLFASSHMLLSAKQKGQGLLGCTEATRSIRTCGPDCFLRRQCVIIELASKTSHNFGTLFNRLAFRKTGKCYNLAHHYHCVQCLKHSNYPQYGKSQQCKFSTCTLLQRLLHFNCVYVPNDEPDFISPTRLPYGYE